MTLIDQNLTQLINEASTVLRPNARIKCTQNLFTRMQKTYSLLALAFSAFVLFAIYDANTGGSDAAAQYVRAFQHGDKIAHFTLFGLLSFLLNLGFGLKRFDLGRYSIYRGSLLVSVFVVIEEASQHYIPTRTFDYYDLMADFAGIVVFVVPTMIIAKRTAAKSI